MSTIPEDIKQMAFTTCQQFMGGAWLTLKYEDFRISQITGGLSNLLYMCEIANDKVKLCPDEAKQVMLRIYGSIIKEHPEMVVTDSVIYALLAEKGLGPQLYGMFSGGRVEEYIPARHLRTSELHLPEVSSECARVMANFHSLKMPLIKKPIWLNEIMDRYLKDVTIVMNTVRECPSDTKFPPAMIATIDKYNLLHELKNLKHLLTQVDSPVTFCHNDMQEGNIFIFENTNDKVHILPIDFEYCGYSYRGFDIGNHFCEWCYNYHEVPEYPFYSAKLEDYPTKEQQLVFVRAYLEAIEMPEEQKKKHAADVNSEEHILREANVFALASHMMWGLWSIIQCKKSTIEFGYLEYGRERFEAYFTQKKQFVQEYKLKELEG